MISIITQGDRRPVQELPFCYWCGKKFQIGDAKNRDHIPPETIFQSAHRDPLILPTHVACNSGHTLADEKLGQLIALRYGKRPRNPAHRRLRFGPIVNTNHTGLTNLEIEDEIWRWVAGFHAALYKEPALGIRNNCSIVTPFPKAHLEGGKVVFHPIKPQHAVFVRSIKTNRARNNLDVISCNKGKCRYECVWNQSDNSGPWMCFFALDVYDWKDLGRTAIQPARGCAGYYVLPSGKVPLNAAIGQVYKIMTPNYDVLDPFAP
jgi:hypothetical protein